MSQSELERFAAAVQATPSLGERYQDVATPSELAARMRADGYEVTDAELEEIARTGSDPAGVELSDDQMNDATGGRLTVHDVLHGNFGKSPEERNRELAPLLDLLRATSQNSRNLAKLW